VSEDVAARAQSGRAQMRPPERGTGMAGAT